MVRRVWRRVWRILWDGLPLLLLSFWTLWNVGCVIGYSLADRLGRAIGAGIWAVLTTAGVVSMVLTIRHRNDMDDVIEGARRDYEKWRR